MELKEYQSNALDVFSRWLDELNKAKVESDKAVAALMNAGVEVPGEIRNYPKTAWENLKGSREVAESAGAYVDRFDEAKRPIPHVCLKVPTGGGKTLLAAEALARMNQQTGLTLWITPTKAIYEQTKAALRNKEHPYRQTLENASGGRVKFIEKDYALTAGDVANYMCVMLLSLPAANRHRNRDFLRMFRDSGRYPTLFPDSDDALGDGRLLEKHPDLERASESGPVKHSLFNAFKMLRPVIVLDEAHKAYGSPKMQNNREFARAVSRLDPSLVIELSATPNRGISNLLVDISGAKLKDEEMIKLPVQVATFTQSEWQDTLTEAHAELEKLDAEARSLEHSEGRYIRPIAVVRVERTGKDQRDSERVHAEDVRDYLSQNLGVPLDAIRVKSAQNDELGNEDLLSEFSPVRWIITKSALMEGWDCPFAYLLVMLDNTQAQRAITQLVGRVMRQPHARRTEREALDQCYVYCWNADVATAVQRVKNGLEREGLDGLGDEVVGIGRSSELNRMKVSRRKRFRGKSIFLPKVLHRDVGGAWIELDYEKHILSEIDWDAIGAPENAQQAFADAPQRQSASVDVGETGETAAVFHESRELYIDKTLSVSWFARRLSDIVPNPWQAARIASLLIKKMRADCQSDDDIYDRRSHLAYVLREHIKVELEKLSEAIFKRKLATGEIRFDLDAGQPNFEMEESYTIPITGNQSLLARNDGKPAQLSLFEPVYDQFDSELEKSFARYLDGQRALEWWHRVAARTARRLLSARVEPLSDMAGLHRYGRKKRWRAAPAHIRNKRRAYARDAGHKVQDARPGRAPKRLQLREDDDTGRARQRNVQAGVRRTRILVAHVESGRRLRRVTDRHS